MRHFRAITRLITTDTKVSYCPSNIYRPPVSGGGMHPSVTLFKLSATLQPMSVSARQAIPVIDPFAVYTDQAVTRDEARNTTLDDDLRVIISPKLRDATDHANLACGLDRLAGKAVRVPERFRSDGEA
jgi:hypothetical protein